MKNSIKIIISLSLIFVISLFTTGCSTDEMDGIDIVVTNYPNEYIVNRLYSDHSKITSIYPDGVDPDTYTLSKKQKKDYASKDIFVYNGLIDKERDLAIELLDLNKNLKIIDSAYILDTDYAAVELWLNPSSLLTMSQNVKNGLEEYITSTYLQKEINEKYKELKIDISALDVDYREAASETKNKSIVISDPSLKYLEKFGLTVYSIDDDASDKTLAEVQNLILKNEISYIFTFEGEELSTNATNIIANNPTIKTLEFYKVNNLTDKQRDNKEDYISLMKSNLTLLNQELYQ